MVRRPASVVAATLLVFLWAACGGPLPPRGSSTTSQPLSSTVPPSTSTSVGPRGFEPGAVSFINVEQGWVLGVMGCPTCGELRSTADGGRSWSVLPVPSVPDRSQASNAVANIYFADGVNGFLFGPGLEITHDGGHTWTSGSIPSVAEVTGAAGYIYLLSQDADLMAPPSLWRAPLGSSIWTRLSLPASAVTGLSQDQTTSYELVSQEHTLLLLQSGLKGPERTATQVGGLWSSTDAGADWSRDAVPCRPADGGAAVTSIALGHSDAWLLDCFDNEQSQQEQSTQHHLYGTADGGRNWVRLVDPTHMGSPDELVDIGSGHAFLTTESGGIDELVGTFDGGIAWSTVLPSTPGFAGWADLQFVDHSTGFIVVAPNQASAILYRTQDGGHTWTPLAFRSS